MRQQKITKNQSGAIAMITVILLMFIFLVVTLGFLRLAISEQRNATDTDLRMRAYFAAESGVEDAKRILGAFYADGTLSASELARLNGNGCGVASKSGTPPGKLSDQLDTEITCQLIELDAGDFVASLAVNESVFIPLSPSPPASGSSVQSVLIEWHETAVEGGVAARATSQTDLPTVNCWNTNENSNCAGISYPAMLRAGLFSHATGPVTRANIEAGNRIAYLNPVNGGVNGIVTVNSFEPKASGGNRNVPSNVPECVPSASGYFCRVLVTDLSGINYLRLTAMYRGTNVRVVMYNSPNPNTATDTPLGFDGVQAKIDVTARAGDVIRRIETRIPLRSVDVLPNEAITTAEQLCKLITIEGSDSAVDECP